MSLTVLPLLFCVLIDALMLPLSSDEAFADAIVSIRTGIRTDI